MKKLVIIILAVMILTACNEPAPTPTPTPTADTRTELEKKISQLEPFDEMYAYLIEDVSAESIDMLKEIYDRYGIEWRPDMDEFGTGTYCTESIDLAIEHYDLAIKETYDRLILYESWGFTAENIGNCVNQISGAGNIITSDEGNVYGLNNTIFNDMGISYYDLDGNLSNEGLRDSVFFSEISNLFLDEGGEYNVNLNGFESYNNFDYISNDNVILMMRAKNIQTEEENDDYLHGELGLLDTNSGEDVREDAASFSEGIFNNKNDFWIKYDKYELIRKKADALAKEYQKLNPVFTIEYIRSIGDPNY